MKAIIAKIKEILNGVFTSFKGAVKKDDEYTVTCISGSYYPIKNGEFFIDYPYGKFGFKVAPDADDSVIGYPTNAQAMAFIDEYKAR